MLFVRGDNSLHPVAPKSILALLTDLVSLEHSVDALAQPWSVRSTVRKMFVAKKPSVNGTQVPVIIFELRMLIHPHAFVRSRASSPLARALARLNDSIPYSRLHPPAVRCIPYYPGHGNSEDSHGRRLQLTRS